MHPMNTRDTSRKRLAAHVTAHCDLRAQYTS